MAGDRVCLRLRLQAPQAGHWVNQDVAGRSFVQRIIDSGGQVLLQAAGQAASDAAGPYVEFVIAGDQTRALLPQGRKARDLQHLIQEVLPGGETDTIVRPTQFAIRLAAEPAEVPSTPAEGGAPVAEFLIRTPAEQPVLVRYAGERGAPGTPGTPGADAPTQIPEILDGGAF